MKNSTQPITLKVDVENAMSCDWEKEFADLDIIPVVDPNNDDCLCPWDATWEVSGDDFVVTGHFESNGYGAATIRVPKADASEYFDIHIQLLEGSINELTDRLEKFGFTWG